jgi:hypothetical protein
MNATLRAVRSRAEREKRRRRPPKVYDTSNMNATFAAGLEEEER